MLAVALSRVVESGPGDQGLAATCTFPKAGATIPPPPKPSASTASIRTEADVHATCRSPGVPGRVIRPVLEQPGPSASAGSCWTLWSATEGTVASRCSCCGTGPSGQVASGSSRTFWNASAAPSAGLFGTSQSCLSGLAGRVRAARRRGGIAGRIAAGRTRPGAVGRWCPGPSAG